MARYEGPKYARYWLRRKRFPRVVWPVAARYWNWGWLGRTGGPARSSFSWASLNIYVSALDFAEALRLDKLGRLKILPVSLALPWGVNVGDLLGHVPLPVKIKQEILEPIDVEERFGDDLDAAYDYVTNRMQETLTKLAAERRFPPFL